MENKIEIVLLLLQAIGAFREAFIVAVGDKSPFAKTALDRIDEATRKAAEAIDAAAWIDATDWKFPK